MGRCLRRRIREYALFDGPPQHRAAAPLRLLHRRSRGLDPAIEPFRFPPIELPELWRWRPWRKISLWQRELFGLSGDVLVLDLDIIVTGSIDVFFDFSPERTFCVIENWTQPGQRIGKKNTLGVPPSPRRAPGGLRHLAG